MARHSTPDPYQEDYERWKAAGFPQQQARPPQPASTRQSASQSAKQAGGRPAVTIASRKLIVLAVIAVLVIAAAIIGHAIASSNSIAAGDCVVTNPNVLTGWDIKKVACGSNPGSSLMVQKVEYVQNGSNGECGAGLTTFQDDPNGKTYCLTVSSFGGG